MRTLRPALFSAIYGLASARPARLGLMTCARGAVLMTCARGAVPVVVEGLRRVAASSPAVIMLHAGSVAVGGLDPGLVGAVAQDAGATLCTRSLCPLDRLRGGPTLATRPGWAMLRRSRPRRRPRCGGRRHDGTR